MLRSLLIVVVLSLAFIGSATAAPAKPAPKTVPKDDRPAGTVGSGAISYEQISSGLQFLIAQKHGIAVNYVLPKGWEVVEKIIPGKDKTPGVFTTMSRRKMSDPSDPTDFIFELSVYEPNITASIPKNLDKKAYDDAVGKRFREFLDAQLVVNIKGKNKVISRAGDISPKAYGPRNDSGATTRPPTTFVPIHYQVPPPKGKGEAAELYTFTGLTGGHIWQLKFLVNQDQLKVYESLIAMIVNNTFALTTEEQKKLEANTEALKQRAKTTPKAPAKSTKSKGKN
ncbi:MAG: hypothetical protein M3R04_04455 [bacterium]|nr:hypothetical protein [bacterium]